MILQDATEQYLDMVALGAHALLRIARQDLTEPQMSEVGALVEEIRQKAEELRAAVKSRFSA